MADEMNPQAPAAQEPTNMPQGTPEQTPVQEQPVVGGETPTEGTSTPTEAAA